MAADPVFALIEANLALGIGARTCIPEWFGEKPDYNWITDALWRRDERARVPVPPAGVSYGQGPMALPLLL